MLPGLEFVISLDAVSLATSTPVRLLPENSVIHNHKYFVLCTGATFPRPRTAVLSCERRGGGCTALARGPLGPCWPPGGLRRAGGGLKWFLNQSRFSVPASLMAECS